MLLRLLRTELNAAWATASEEMYKAAADAGQAQPGADGAGAGRTCTRAETLILLLILTSKKLSK